MALALMGAIFDLIPDFFRLFAPSKWSAAPSASLGGKVFFFDSFRHSDLTLIFKCRRTTFILSDRALSTINLSGLSTEFQMVCPPRLSRVSSK